MSELRVAILSIQERLYQSRLRALRNLTVHPIDVSDYIQDQVIKDAYFGDDEYGEYLAKEILKNWDRYCRAAVYKEQLRYAAREYANRTLCEGKVGDCREEG